MADRVDWSLCEAVAPSGGVNVTGVKCKCKM